MEFTVTGEMASFRDEVRTWLEENKPSERRPVDGPEMREFDTGWQRRQYDGGWAGIAWPTEYGGRGLGLTEQLIWYEEYARAGAPAPGSMFVALNHGGPTLIARGTEAQKSFHLPLILRGDAVWCQGFSEPNAGSDLAALNTRAHVEGDHLVVNGQKIWTSFAQHSRYQELLVRTDPTSAKHKGITWAICDMTTPGIEIRPIRTMSGRYAFAEVFYTDVRIPLENVVGEINDGWSVAMATLGFERGTAFMSAQVELSMRVERLIELARTTRRPGGGNAIDDDGMSSALARLRADVTALRAITYLTVSRARRAPLDSRASITKLFHSEIQKRIQRLAVEILGDGIFAGEGVEKIWTFDYYDTFWATIAAGTSEVQRNIIGERVLGLPRVA